MSSLPPNALHVGQSGSFRSCLDDLCLCSYTRLCLSLGLALSCCFLAFFLLLPLPSLLFCLYMWQEALSSKEGFRAASLAGLDCQSRQAASTLKPQWGPRQVAHPAASENSCVGKFIQERWEVVKHKRAVVTRAELHGHEARLLGLLLRLHLLCEGTGDPGCSVVPLVWLMCHEPATREAR